MCGLTDLHGRSIVCNFSKFFPFIWELEMSKDHLTSSCRAPASSFLLEITCQRVLPFQMAMLPPLLAPFSVLQYVQPEARKPRTCVSAEGKWSWFLFLPLHLFQRSLELKSSRPRGPQVYEALMSFFHPSLACRAVS